jgi:ribosomal protein L37E
VAYFPDILEHLGKTPRELGTLQVCLERVSVDDAWATAIVWVQAAFDPYDAAATFRLQSVQERPLVLMPEQPVPSAPRGAVVRGCLRFRIPDHVTRVSLCVTGVIPKGSRRCRVPWRLFDTIETPKESALRPPSSVGLNVDTTLAGELLTLPLGSFRGTSVSSESSRTVVHAAQQLTEGYQVDVVRAGGRPEPQGFRTIWRPGEPLPAAEPPAPPGRAAQAAPKPVKTHRDCRRCNFSGKLADFAVDKYCPACGFEWS